MKAAVLIAAVVVVGALSTSCILFGGAIPCASAANCPGTEVCVAGFCATEAGPQQVGRCGEASRAVVDASLEADDDSTRHYKTIRAAVEALSAAQVEAPCIDLLEGTYRENAPITLTPGTTLKGNNPFQQGSPQTIIFSRQGDGPTGFLITEATLEAVVVEGNGTVVAPTGADAAVFFSMNNATIANGGAVVLRTSAPDDVLLVDSAFVRATLSVDAPEASVGLTNTRLERSRVEITQGASLTITGSDVDNDDNGMLLSTRDTKVFDVDVDAVANGGCAPAFLVGGGKASFSGVRVRGLGCPALVIRDEIQPITSVQIGTSGNDEAIFANDALDVLVDLSPASAGAVITAVDVDWSSAPECGVAVCTCTTDVTVTTVSGACGSRCEGDLCING